MRLESLFRGVIFFFLYIYILYTIYIFLAKNLGIQLNTHASILGPSLMARKNPCLLVREGLKDG